jgi:hypothetical protein
MKLAKFISSAMAEGCFAWYGNDDMRQYFLIFIYLGLIFLVGCAPQVQAMPASTVPAAGTTVEVQVPVATDVAATQSVSLPLVIAQPTETPTPTATPERPLRIAVIGDFGLADVPEADVAALVSSWEPDLVITTGDNNYPNGSVETIDENIGQYYHQYIFPYTGQFGEGADLNRFFPTLGNHDWQTPDAQPYMDFFTLPGNERYYDYTWGTVHFFALDSDSREPDGVGSGSAQASWLQERLSASTAVWKIVYMHHPPYSSGIHGSVDWTRWPYQEWGATAVLSGHDHIYERLLVDGLPYFVNGLGGGPIYSIPGKLEGSQVRYNDDYGAMRVEATSNEITFEFITRAGEVIDTYTIPAPSP